jgi:hypothetical protein
MTRAGTLAFWAPDSPNKITKNVQLDAGINFWVTRAADRSTPSSGSQRASEIKF